MKDITSNQVFMLAFPFVIVFAMGLLVFGIRTGVRYSMVTRVQRKKRRGYAPVKAFQKMPKTPETEKALGYRRHQARRKLAQDRDSSASNDTQPVRARHSH